MFNHQHVFFFLRQLFMTLRMSCLHRGPYIQRGRGIGSTLRAMFKGVVPVMQVMGQKLMASPITKRILKTAKQSAIEAGVNVATDTLGGKNVGKSLAENVTTASKAVTDSLVSALKKVKANSNSEIKKPPTKRKRGVAARKSKKKRYSDIFEENF